MNIIMTQIEKKFNAYKTRERILIVAALMVIIYWLWSTLLYDYVLATDEEIARKAAEIKSQIGLLEGQIDSISEVVGRNPTIALAQQAQGLKKENEALTRKIYENTKKMVSSKDMTAILRNVIKKSQELILVDMESLPSKPLFPAKTLQQDNKTVNFQAFNHGLKVEMLGTYFETMQFLKAIEQENANVMWDELSYEVVKYPQARIIVYLHTLGLEEGWIGV